jgi:hypothetical protein
MIGAVRASSTDIYEAVVALSHSIAGGRKVESIPAKALEYSRTTIGQAIFASCRT